MTDLPLVRGDRHELTVSGLVDKVGEATIFAATDVIRFTVRADYGDDEPLIAKTSAAGGGITFTPGQDTALIVILPADFDDLDFDAEVPIVWDCEVTLDGDATRVVTIDGGEGTISPDVTRAQP